MEVLRQLTQLEKGYSSGNESLYFSFVITQTFTENQIIKAIDQLVGRHRMLRSFIQDEMFVEKTTYMASDYIERVDDIPLRGEQFEYELPSDALFRLLFRPKMDGTTRCLFLIHHTIADATSALQIINDFVSMLLQPKREFTKSLDLPPVEQNIYTYTDAEVQTFAMGYQNRHPATCRLPVTCPEYSYEETRLQEQTIVIREDTYIKLIEKAHMAKVSFHGYLTALLLHAMRNEEDPQSACVATSVDLKRRMKKSPKDAICNGAVLTTTFLDLLPTDTPLDTAKKYRGSLESKIQSGEHILEYQGLVTEQINYFTLGLSFLIVDLGSITFSDPAISDSIAELSFTMPVKVNAPVITTLTYDKMLLLSISYPTPWFDKETIDGYVKRLSHLLQKEREQ